MTKTEENKFATPEAYFEEFSGELLHFLNIYQENFIYKILEDHLYKEEPQRFFFTIIQKTCNVLDVINLLIRNFENKPHFENSICILIRSILSDIIVAEYVIIKAKNKLELFKEIIDSIMLDHLSMTFNNLESIYPLINNWTKEYTEEQKRKFISFNQNNFDENGKILRKSLKVSPSYLLKKIFNEKNKEQEYRLLIRAFNYYDIYSKFEHLGQLSLGLVNRPFIDEDLQKRFFEMFECLGVIISALKSYTRCWEESFNIPNHELDNSIERIFSLLPIYIPIDKKK